MQEPLFQEYGVDGKEFWKEVDGLPEFYKTKGIHISKDTAYLNHILTYVRHGIFPGLTNSKLSELGARLEFYPGLPEFLRVIKETIQKDQAFAQHEIKIEHYVVSTGIRLIIEGSAVASYLDGIWACEFIEEVALPGQAANRNRKAEKLAPSGVASARVSSKQSKQQMRLEGEKEILQIGYMLDNTTKTRAIFEINKGTNKLSVIDVNACIGQEDRRVPFQNMIYIADGPSDIPCFSIINQYGGRTFAVYKSGSKEEFAQVNSLQQQGRVQSYGEANYNEGSQTFMWILHTVKDIAQRIAQDRARALRQRIQPPPTHIPPSLSKAPIKYNGRASGYPQPAQSEQATPLAIGGNMAGLCPDCGSTLIYQEGCFFCHACGYTKCV